MKRAADIDTLPSPSKKKAKTSTQPAVRSQFRDVDREHVVSSGRAWRTFEDELPGANVLYLPDFLEAESANELLKELEGLDTWYRPTLRVYGKSITQSRAIAAYSTFPDLVVKYSGTVVEMHHPYPSVLAKLQARVEEVLGLADTAEGATGNDDENIGESRRGGFNHVMLNRYDDGSVYIGRHNDTKENNVIASLSLGAERTFIMTPATSKKAKDATSGASAVKWTLGNGSLLVMQGDTQLNWKHEIPKEPKVKECRISLTFRQVRSVG